MVQVNQVYLLLGFTEVRGPGVHLSMQANSRLSDFAYAAIGIPALTPSPIDFLDTMQIAIEDPILVQPPIILQCPEPSSASEPSF